MRILLLDGHPDKGRLSSHLLDIYARSLPEESEIERVAVRDLEFGPILTHGYAKRTEWEPDLHRIAEKIDACDHLVVAFPMWWGAEPAELKGLLDRLFLPGFAFAYHPDDPWWDKLFEGRSADVLMTMDTPAIFLRFVYGNAIVKRWKKQVLGFCGFDPVRVLVCSPIKQGGVEKGIGKWSSKISRMAHSIAPKSPEKKRPRLEAFLNRKPD